MEDTTNYGQSLPVPDVEELQQEAPELARVPVSLELGTVYRLPARRAICSTDVVGDTTAIGVAAVNPRRNRVVLVSLDEPVYIARDSLSTGALWPANVPYVGEHADAIFVKCATTSQTTSVGVVQELWAD